MAKKEQATEAETKPATREDMIKSLYNKGKSHYDIAKEVYEFVNDDTLGKVAQVVNPSAAAEAEAYENKENE